MWSKIKKVMGIVTPVALEFVPAKFLPVAKTVYAGVVSAEKSGERGETKLAIAMRYATLLLPGIAEAVEKITNREVVDQEALTKALEHLASFMVQIEKAVGKRPS